MSHLTPEEFVEATDETLPPARRAHLASCDACRRDVAQLAGLLGEVAKVPVPEPSPVFWDRFAARVRDAVEQEQQPQRGGRGWWRWPAVAPLGALALVLLALVGTAARRGVVEPEKIAAASSVSAVPATDVTLDGESWDLVAELVGPLDWETAGAAGLAVAPGDVDALLLDLEPDERRELSHLLEGELARTKS